MLLSQIIKNKGDFEILSFEQLGRAVRLLLPIYGKVSQSLVTLEIPELGLHNICRKVTYQFWAYQDDEKMAEQAAKYQLCRQKLLEAKIPCYLAEVESDGGQINKHLTAPKWCKYDIFMFCEHGIYLSSFRIGNSDDPEVWRKNQKDEENRRKIKKVEDALDRKE